MSYREYGDAVARVATGLRGLGVRRGDRIVLMLRNIPEFHVIDLACVFVGAVPISIYNSSSAEQIGFFARHSHAAVRHRRGRRVRSRASTRCADELPELEAIVSVRGSGDAHYAELSDAPPLDLAEAATTVGPDDLLTVIYTSGTTGDPKGVMITHGQVRFTAESLQLACGFSAEQLVGMRIVSYLPMAHIAERMTSHYDGVPRRLRGHDVPRHVAGRRVPARRPAQHHVRRPARSGRRSMPASSRRSRPTPTRLRSSTTR